MHTRKALSSDHSLISWSTFCVMLTNTAIIALGCIGW
jgi:hypothetical protein